MALPTLSEEQRKAALARAGEVRRLRAQFKTQVKSGALDPVVALETALNDKDLAKMTVQQFLRALPGVGESTCAKVMEDAKIPARRRMGGLGVHQRERLEEWLAHR